MKRRSFLAGIAAFASGKSVAQPGAATRSTGPIRFIEPYAAGGPSPRSVASLASLITAAITTPATFSG